MPVTLDQAQREIEVLDIDVRRIRASISNVCNNIISNISIVGHTCNLKPFSFSHLILKT